jgi:hypothetical protein
VPDVGEIEVIAGGTITGGITEPEITVKEIGFEVPYLALDTVMEYWPKTASWGTVKLRTVPLDDICAVVVDPPPFILLNIISLLISVVKFVPVITTAVPTGPVEVEREVIFGATITGGFTDVTVKVILFEVIIEFAFETKTS